MFMVKIQETAKRNGLETIAVKTQALALAKAAESPALIVIDLNYAPAQPLELIQALKADEATKSIHLLAFVSHVQTDLRSAAVTAGCDTVVPRSTFAQTLTALLTQMVA